MARVLLTGFCAVPGPRRAGVQMRHLINALSAHHQVDLLVAREGEQAYVERQGTVRILRVPTQEGDLRSQVQGFQRALKRQLDGADYDFVHCRDPWSCMPVLEARGRLHYGVVYDLSRSALGDTTFDPELDAQYGRDEEACLLAADLVLAPTHAAVEALAGRGRPERVMLSPPGVDIDRFDWDDLPKKDPPLVLYAGSMDPGRGVRVLIRAFAAIAREIDARLVLAGPVTPKFDQALRDAIREEGLGPRVDVLGAVEHEQMPTLIATATVCVVPAAPDLSPNPTVLYPTKLLEYMACRTPIVAPRRDTVLQVITDNREALLFEPGDPVDLARQVLRFLEEPQLRRTIALHAYERVRKDFTASAARRAIRAAYAVLVDRFADQIEDEEPSKVEVLPGPDGDDDFEATVYEEAPALANGDHTAETKVGSLEAALASLDDATGARRTTEPTGDTSGEVIEMVVEVSGEILSGEIATILVDDGDDGTPIQGVNVRTTPRAMEAVELGFVAGEIDVPSASEAGRAVDTGSIAAKDPDTGSRTPPIERR